MERMSILDAGFYFAENENIPMHVGSVVVFEGPAPAYGDLVRLLMSKLPLMPRYRQRVRPVPMHLGRPVWVDDDHFQILYHVRHTAVPPPGSEEQLRNLAGRVFAQRLDMAKPLWEMWLVEGLQEERWALISKTHHCMIDGVAGMDLATILVDGSPDPGVAAAQSWTPAQAPSTAQLVVSGVRDTVAEPLRQLAGIPARARNLPSREAALNFGRGLLTSVRGLGTPTARDLNGPIGPHRRWEWVQLDLKRVKRVRQAFRGTVNDVVLAAVTHGFRALLGKRGQLADGDVVRSLVPVSVRAPHERGVLNNRVSALLVNLPIGEPDPVRRLALLREQMDNLKGSRQAMGAQALTELAGFAAPTLLAMGSRLTFRFPQSMMQTVTTNVPGPRVPLFMLGRRVIEMHPYVPIAYNMRISIGIFSYLDQLNFGINADFDAVPDIDVLRRGISDGLTELVERAESASATGDDRTTSAATSAKPERAATDAKPERAATKPERAATDAKPDETAGKPKATSPDEATVKPTITSPNKATAKQDGAASRPAAARGRRGAARRSSTSTNPRQSPNSRRDTSP